MKISKTISAFLLSLMITAIGSQAQAATQPAPTGDRIKITIRKSLTPAHWDGKIGRVVKYSVMDTLGFVTFDNGKIGVLQAEGFFANEDDTLQLFGLLANATSAEIFNDDDEYSIRSEFAESLIEQIDPDLVNADPLEMVDLIESAMGLMNTEMVEVIIQMPSPNEIMSEAAVHSDDGGWTYVSGDGYYVGYKAGDENSGQEYQTDPDTGKITLGGDKDVDNDGQQDKDSDGDGKTDEEEKKNGTDPNDKDDKIIWGKERLSALLAATGQFATDQLIQNVFEMYAHDSVSREELVLSAQTLLQGYLYRYYQ